MVEPAPSGCIKLHILNPKAHGKDNIIIRRKLMITAFFLEHPLRSIVMDKMFSNTAMIVVSAAKDIKTKNKDPHNLPIAISLKIFGKVTKTRPGPSPGFTPKEKHAGKMISPATRATVVSNKVTFTLSCKRLRSFPR